MFQKLKDLGAISSAPPSTASAFLKPHCEHLISAITVGMSTCVDDGFMLHTDTQDHMSRTNTKCFLHTYSVRIPCSHQDSIESSYCTRKPTFGEVPRLNLSGAWTEQRTRNWLPVLHLHGQYTVNSTDCIYLSKERSTIILSLKYYCSHAHAFLADRWPSL